MKPPGVPPRVSSVLIVGALLTVACASMSAPNFQAADSAATEAVELVVGEAPTGPTETYTYPALGGIRFTVSSDYQLYAQGDRVMISPSADLFNGGVAYVGLATQDSLGAPLMSVEHFFAALSGIEAEANGRYAELFDYELVGYSTSPADGLTTGSVGDILPSVRIGAGSPHEWTPRDDEIFLAETAAGVLYLGYSRAGATTGSVAFPAFSELIASAELTGPGLDERLPDGGAPSGNASAPQPNFVEGGPQPLLITFNDVFPGEYQLSNFAAAVSVEVPQGWVALLNRPGTVVLAGNRSGGVGDEEIHFAAGLEQHLVSQSGGPSATSETTELTDIESFLESPPGNLNITNITATTVADFQATRFDVVVRDDVSCAQDDPCEYTFEMEWNWDFPPTIRAESFHRIWWIEGHPAGSAVVVAVDNDPEFLDRATAVVESMEAVG